MTAKREKRNTRRRNCEIPMIFTDQNKDCFFWARACNYSRGGLCFETDFAPSPGQKIYTIREDENRNYEYFRPDLSGSVSAVDSMAEVKWRVPMPAKEGSAYRVGVRYPQRRSPGR